VVGGMLLGLKVKSYHKSKKSILHTRAAIHRHSLGGVTGRWRGIELHECLLVFAANSGTPVLCVVVKFITFTFSSLSLIHGRLFISVSISFLV